MWNRFWDCAEAIEAWGGTWKYESKVWGPTSLPSWGLLHPSVVVHCLYAPFTPAILPAIVTHWSNWSRRREVRWGKGWELPCLTACRRGLASIQNELFLSCNACFCSVDTPFLPWLSSSSAVLLFQMSALACALCSCRLVATSDFCLLRCHGTPQVATVNGTQDNQFHLDGTKLTVFRKKVYIQWDTVFQPVGKLWSCMLVLLEYDPLLPYAPSITSAG